MSEKEPFQTGGGDGYLHKATKDLPEVTEEEEGYSRIVNTTDK